MTVTIGRRELLAAVGGDDSLRGQGSAQFEIMPHLPILREPSCRDHGLCVPYR